MWQDVETADDYLNFGELAGLAADLIRNPGMLPLSLGVFGGWGTGKSTLLQLIQAELGDEKILLVKFDAWLFQGYDDARAALLEEIVRHLEEAAKANEGLLKKTGKLLKRINYLRVLGAATDVGVSLFTGIPTFGTFGRGMSGIANYATGTPEKGDRDAVQKAAGEAFKEGKDGLIAPHEQTTPPVEIRAFRREFKEVIEELETTVVVFIDNLDRCLPTAAIETLEAMRLFLFLPQTAFVIAADEGMIRHAVSKHYDGLPSRHVQDYLDKLIQVPIRAPKLGVKEVQSYIFLLYLKLSGVNDGDFRKAQDLALKNMQAGWEEGPLTPSAMLKVITSKSPELRNHLDLGERLSPILANAPNILGNPRIVKRLLNSLRMRFDLARRRGITIDEALLAKLAVLERGTDEQTYAYLVRTVVDDADGTPAILKTLEDSLGEDTWGEVCPEAWKGQHEEFVKLWLGLEPKLGGRDLRTAVYLSRENVPLAPPPGELSYRGVQAVTALREVNSIHSHAAQEVVDGLSPSDRSGVLDGLIRHMRQADTWRRPVPGFKGAYILVDKTPQLGERFVGFLQQLPPEDVGQWISPLLRKANWATDLLVQWRDAPNGPLASKKKTGGKKK